MTIVFGCELYLKPKFRGDTVIKCKLKELDSEVTKWQWYYKSKYYEEVFEDTSNLKKTWANINKVLGRNSPKSDYVDEVVVDGKVIKDDSEKASAFNSFFTEIGHKICDKINSAQDVNVHSTLQRSVSSIFFEPAYEDEILNLLTSLDVTKSTGYDEITAIALRRCADVIASVVTCIVNLTMFTGVYPDALKVARVLPVYKAESKTDPSNYRPISILPVINKIFELVLHKRLMFFLESNNFFYKRQYGFRKRSGTHTATYELLNQLLLDIDSGKVTSAVFLDIMKAFDCVDHKVLLIKLEYAGVRGVFLNLFKSYLSNRQQFVVVGSAQSGLRRIDIGVPQGSVLGPLLFLIYINDIHRLPLKGSISLFADDTGDFCSNVSFPRNVEDMNHDLSLIDGFLRANKMSLNVSKTKVIHFRKRRAIVGDVVLNGQVVEVVSVYKYLGLLIDENLSWGAHVTKLAKKIASVSGVFSKLKHFIPKSVLMKVYFALVHSRLNYLAGVWGQASKKCLNQVKVLQKRCLKHVCKLPQRHSTSDLFNDKCPGVLNIDSLIKLNACTFIHDVINGQCHSSITFKKSHQHFTRKKGFLFVPGTKLKLGSRALTVSGSALYNSLPKSMLTLKASVFRKKLKEWLSECQYPG